MAVEALQKEREDALRATKDAQRKAEEERLAAAMAESVRDAAQGEAARRRMELEGMGRSLPFLLPTGADLWAMS
jgi:hypothetical protein